MVSDFRHQPDEILSGILLANGGVAQVSGIWHVAAYVTGTTGSTLTAIQNSYTTAGTVTAIATVTAAVAVPGTNAATTVGSVIVEYLIPVIGGNQYTLAATGLTIVGGSGVILPA